MNQSLSNLARDPEGFLLSLDDWDLDTAAALATEEGLELGPAHMEVIELVRQLYLDTEFTPPMRGLVKLVRERLGADKGGSIYLLGLFPGRPVKLIAKIAGVPKPDHCL